MTPDELAALVRRCNGPHREGDWHAASNAMMEYAPVLLEAWRLADAFANDMPAHSALAAYRAAVAAQEGSKP